jgi:hypothetical protein
MIFAKDIASFPLRDMRILFYLDRHAHRRSVIQSVLLSCYFMLSGHSARAILSKPTTVANQTCILFAELFVVLTQLRLLLHPFPFEIMLIHY